jgi:transposase InsO family protein
VVERFFGVLKYEHAYRALIDDEATFTLEINLFRQIYNTIRPHQALGDSTPRSVYLAEPRSGSD